MIAFVAWNELCRHISLKIPGFLGVQHLVVAPIPRPICILKLMLLDAWVMDA